MSPSPFSAPSLLEPSLSVAIPLYNEEEGLLELYRRTSSVLDDLPGGEHEILFVDDGSTDGTAEYLEELVRIDSRVKVVLLSRNFGHQVALTAAIEHTSGDVVVLMDGDLQDVPETIPAFLEKYAEGYDVVYAIRQERKEGPLKRFCYAAFYQVISRLTAIDIPRNAGDFSLLSRRVVDQLRSSPERHRFLRGLRTWIGFRQIGIPVERDGRYAGESKYTVRKLFQLAFDGIFSFSVAPLRAATLLGAITLFGSLAFTAYALLAHLFFSQSPAGFTALIVSITFLAGIQLLFLGLIGEYVGRIFEEVKQRPHYVIDRLLTQGTLPQPGMPRELRSLPQAAPPSTKESELSFQI